jgi:peroxiredoxin
MPIRKYVPYALAGLIALAIGVWAARAFYMPDTRHADAPDLLWAMRLSDQYGKPQSLAQWHGKVLVLNFWATWCSPCREEIPDFIALRTQYRTQNVEMVGIAIDSAQPVARYAQDMHIPYPVLVGEGEALGLARALGNSSGALPYTVVINPAGRIILRHLGRLPRSQLEAALTQITTGRADFH